jgi:hypothetical protein
MPLIPPRAVVVSQDCDDTPAKLPRVSVQELASLPSSSPSAFLKLRLVRDLQQPLWQQRLDPPRSGIACRSVISFDTQPICMLHRIDQSWKHPMPMGSFQGGVVTDVILVPHLILAREFFGSASSNPSGVDFPFIVDQHQLRLIRSGVPLEATVASSIVVPLPHPSLPSLRRRCARYRREGQGRLEYAIT